MRQVIATAVCGLLIALAVTSCGGQGSHGGYAREFDPQALSEKPWQSWNPAEISWGLRHYDEIFESRTVPAGTRPRPLEAGPSIARLAAGTHGGTELEKYLEDQRIAGLLVLQDGRILFERYGLGHSKFDRWTSQSVAKSVTSTLVGIALREGFIRSLDDPVSGYIEGLRGSAYDEVSVRQLLTMTSGIHWIEDYTNRDSDLPRLYATTPAPGLSVATTYMRTLHREFAPGEQWVYNTGETHLLGDLVRFATGRTLSDYLSEKIWKPYGMEAPASWIVDGSGAEEAGCCLQASLRDFGRFGQFVLDGGRINDSLVVSDGWFKEATSAHEITDSAGSGYGYQWWSHPDGTFSAFGIYGQMIHIDPVRRLVVVLNSAWPEALNPERSAARREFLALIKSAIDDEAADT